MSLVVALLWATAIGLIALFPGFHFAMVLLVCGPWLLAQFGLSNGLLALAWAVVLARTMHTLAVVYHPVAADQLASAAPAQRLAYMGQGRFATRLMGDALWLSVVSVTLVVAGALVLGSFLDANLFKAVFKILGWVSVPAFVLWFGYTMYQAKRKLETLLVFTASGVLGIVALQHPAVLGAHQAMTPLLTGLFGFPILLLTLLERHRPEGTPHGAQLEKVPERDPDDGLRWFGLLVGMVSVVLPGLGASSLVSLGQDLSEDDAQYLTMTSIAEGTGELLALVLGILGIASRSSDASVIQRLCEAGFGSYVLGPVFPFALLGAIVGSCWVGLKLVNVLGIPYRVMVAIIPSKLQAAVVGLAMVWVVWTHTSAWGITIMLAGTLIHLGARKLGTPNQAFFACLVGPMVFTMLGLSL